MNTTMTAWLPGMSEPTKEAQDLVYKFETEGGRIVEINEDDNSARIELFDGKSFWISQDYLEKSIN